MSRPWEDPDLIAYKRLVRGDPCTYCGNTGGTIDHIVPRPEGGLRWDWTNWTGCCPNCNQRKDMGKDGGHRRVLDFLGTRRENRRNTERLVFRDSLRPGDTVFTPWGEEGEVVRVEGRRVFVWLPAQQREWRCGNLASLRDANGWRLVNRSTIPTGM